MPVTPPDLTRIAASRISAGAAEGARRTAAWSGGMVLCVALPWITPWAAGPSVNTIPLLVSWAFSALALMLSPSLPRRLPAVLAGLAAMCVAIWALDLTPKSVTVMGAVAAATACATAVSAGQNLQDRERLARLAAMGWLLAALASSAMALLQYFGVASWLGALINGADVGEAYANLRQRNQFATLTTLGLVSLLWLAQGSSRRMPAALALAVLGAANAASASRTGLIQWLLVLVLAAAWPGPHRRRWVSLCVGALAAYLVAAFSLPLMLERLTGQTSINVFLRISAQAACGTRSVLWPNVLELIADRPWTGWGWGELGYAHYMHLYAGSRFCDILDNAHNLPLHLAVEAGLPLALAACGAGAWLLARARPWREMQPYRRVAWTALAAIMMHSLVEYPLWYGPFQMAAGFAVGMLWPMRRGMGGPGGVAAKCTLGLCCAVALGYAATDYWRVSQLYLAPEQRAPGYRLDTLSKVYRSWIFHDHVAFAELTTTTPSHANASHVHALALSMLHFSTEPRVIEKLIESALLLGRDEEAAAHMQRYRAAFPQEYKAWIGSQTNLNRASP